MFYMLNKIADCGRNVVMNLLFPSGIGASHRFRATLIYPSARIIELIGENFVLPDLFVPAKKINIACIEIGIVKTIISVKSQRPSEWRF
ncbi:hypothetical protein QF32_17620 [Salmonella enterica subsp. enterica]|nr:hypothetical protein [Salmonella enterica subsp. enterica]EED2935884.1 hypothetical protein [Salmonella enterica subsp. enterica]